MLQRPFRFLHAADLHLDRPCETAAELPDHLLDRFVDAPWQAATKLFDAALDQHVDFMILSGDVVDPLQAAPRELLFLVEQFQRLSDRNIPVYWSGGPVDAIDQWPSYVAWPNNVHRFPRGRVQRYQHQIAGAPVCEIIGCSHDASQSPRPYDFAPSGADMFSIAVAHAPWNARALGEIGVNYWALGGQHNRSTPLELNAVAHFAGTSQGRCCSETGSHGCTMVAIDEHRHVRLTPTPCDLLRWLAPQVSLANAADRADLERALHERSEQLLADSSGVALLVTWQIACEGPLRFALRHGSLGAELISGLQEKFGHRQPPLWTLAIEAELPEQLPAPWYAEETLRGDFLRAVRQCAERLAPGDHGEPDATASAETSADFSDSSLQELNLSLNDTLSDLLTTEDHSSLSAELMSRLESAFHSPQASPCLLREIAWLGADLLGPAEAPK